ncbi:MAG: hypothetical protein BMS9Abin12_0890 [Acidimicrobiia bacterium]|nr:MAG: hypothetical protein BMS9Abin12_0890 [Acidimicrobiia bacterium]
MRGNHRADSWLKGNTHTHTLWSDGDAAPEWVADWYQHHGYDFLVLSDHNVLSRGETWVRIGERDLSEHRVDELLERFGTDRVDIRRGEHGREMRLQTLEELRARFDLLFIEGEEITDKFDDHHIHVGAVNLEEVIPPQGGLTLRETLNNNVAAVLAQASRLDRPMLAHVNHPNWYWSLSWEDVAHVTDDRFFEVYNGHSAVSNEGDSTHPSCEEMWDLANTLRVLDLGLPLLYGLATDDSHEYFTWGAGQTNPGRGWVMVRGDNRDADEIVNAMRRGDFYASSGVTIREFRIDSDHYEIDIVTEPGVDYMTRFVGTTITDAKRDPVAETLLETTSNPASYTYRGDELFVRAVVTSSRLHPNPYREGDHEMAWLQPTRP